MKQQKVYMKTWLDFHDRAKMVQSDLWYLEFANSLLPIISEFPLYKESGEKSQQMTAVRITLYLEDCVSDSGNWRQFIRWHQRSYGRYLPFYTLTEDYFADEVNEEDLAFLLWGINSPVGEDYTGVADPFDADLLELAHLLYEKVNGAFEKAPMSDELAGDWLMETKLMETKLMETKRISLSAVSPDDKLPTDVERFMKTSGGESLLFFDSYATLKLFFVQTLQWDDEEDSLLSELAEFEDFVLYANLKGILIGPDITSYFADQRNPLYSVEASEVEAYEMFCEQGLCPFDLLKYGMEHQLLPDAQFPFERGKELLHENWDFVARWFLREYYEGE